MADTVEQVLDTATPTQLNGERGLTMAWHAALIGIVAYIIMTVLAKQEASKSENNSLVIAAVALVYMILYGHSFPPNPVSSQ